MTDQVLARLLLDIAIVVAVAHVCGALLRRMGQPPVLGEILGGIALGPTLLGTLPGDPSTLLFPDNMRMALGAIGAVGLVLFMFLAGLELDTKTVRRHDRALAAVSLGAVVLPFVLGIGLAALLYGSHDTVAGHHVNFLSFALFIGTALSITAFPVLVRIVTDRGMRGTVVGEMSIASAAVQDTVGWLLLAVALAAHAGGDALDILRIVLLGLAFAAALAFVLRPLMVWACARTGPDEELSVVTAAWAIAGLAACAATTQAIGLHSVLGAFAFGLAFPRSAPQILEGLRRMLAPLTMVVLLPVYFLGPGLQLNLRALDAAAIWQFGAAMTCACAGKFVGTFVPARLAGMRPRDAGTLGVLLNTRGLIELVVLTVGLNAGVLDQGLFSILVLVAIGTTLATGPLISYLSPSPVRRGVPGRARGRADVVDIGEDHVHVTAAGSGCRSPAEGTS
jgi:Kef-type K+ transport system membrane component KefB